jgi:mono/diheme cytochrome c family protein
MTMRRTHALLLLSAFLAGCRGGISNEPPVHLVLDMDFQQKIKAQSAFEFAGWPDGRGMRLPVEGTVARGSLPNPTLLPDPKNPGKNPDGSYIEKNPLPLTEAVIERGRERFNITCAVCHGYSGRGGTGAQAHGMVGKRWPASVSIPSFHAKAGGDATVNRVPELKDGQVFEVISNGKGTMPKYGRQISVEDRWSIIHYLRALQLFGKQ